MGSFASISRPADFHGVLAQGKRGGDRGLTIHVRRSGGPEARLGLVVRGRNAVTRNRVKRRLRAAVREAAPKNGTDVVIRADGRAAGRNYQEMVSMVRKALEAGERS